MKYKLLLQLVGMSFLLVSLISCTSASGTENKSPMESRASLKALIIDGQNNHEHWPKTTMMMKRYLEESGLFEVDIARTAFAWKGEKMLKEYALASAPTEVLDEPKVDPNFKPNFSAYDVVVSNFGWKAADWSEETQKDFEEYVFNGGGLVIVHAANNSFPKWEAYNKMIGIGGWGGRTEKDGPYVYFNDEGKEVRDGSPGNAGAHGPQHEYIITLRDNDHPITMGMPTKWVHALDELYDKLRGPAENMKILATAYSAEDKKGTGRHEPMLIVLEYGKGRIFHTPMGHADYSFECVGFISSFNRGTEWA
ncbi:MAG: ThuA domain-containing protein, partial [Bacteroidota bacterium]